MDSPVAHAAAPASARWYFDFISPFAYLQWQRLRAHPLPVPLEPVPILFAALLDHWGQRGPAEIPLKRRFTYRYVTWRGQADGIPLRAPPAHPFNPLAALRLCLALDCRVEALDAIFEHIWSEGRAGDSVDALAHVTARFGIEAPAAACASPAVKAALRTNTETAIGAGVFGVPTIAIGGELFWGDDATQMARDFLADPGMFESEEMRRIDELPVAASRVG